MIPSLEEKRDLICEAIANRRIVEFIYNKEPRIVEPYQCGVGLKNSWQLSGFQIAGKSISNPKLGWRKFLLADISSLLITEREFHTWSGDRRLYNPADKAFKQFFCKITK